MVKIGVYLRKLSRN